MATSSDLSIFGFRSSPFTKEIDDADLWLPESKAALVADIEASLAERQSVLLLGEPGVGKTCVLRALRHNLSQAGFRLTYCRNATLGRRDFYRYLCHALGLHPTSSAANLFLAVETHVQDLRRDKAHPVFLLDEVSVRAFFDGQALEEFDGPRVTDGAHRRVVVSRSGFPPPLEHRTG
jgi:general secretion pathway protein A